MQFQIDKTDASTEATTEATASDVLAPSFPEVSTLPAIKPLAEKALERMGLAMATIERLKGYGKLVLSDLTDKKGAKDLTEKRLEVKRFRNALERECKSGREEANAISKGWVSAEKALSEPFEEIEEHLAKQVEAHEAELARIAQEAEQDRKQKIAARIEAVVTAGAPVNLEKIETLGDEGWEAYLSELAESKRLLDTATAIAEELTALGDECTVAEALQLEPEQAEHRLAVARKADHDRKETARLAEEEAEAERQRIATAEKDRLERIASEERATRERLERGYLRGRELSLVDCTGHEVEELADMTEEAFDALLASARQEKKDRDARAADERRQQEERDAELARLRRAEADRLEAERLALEQREREAIEAAERAEQEAREAREQAEREEQERLEAERLEAQRPEREKVSAWAQAALDAMPSTPNIEDPDILRAMRDHVERARMALLDLRERMTAEPTN